MLLTKDTDQAQARKFLQTAIYCPNACYDLQAQLSLTYSGLQVNVTGTQVCTDHQKAPDDPAQSPKMGCASGEQQPKITISTKDVYSRVIGFNVKDQSVTKSRCDDAAIDSSVSKFFTGLQQVTTDPAVGEAQMQAALDSLNGGSVAAVQPQPLTQNAGTSALAQVLTGQFNVSDPVSVKKAEVVLEKVGVAAPVAIDAIRRIGSGDSDGAKQILSAAGLSSTLMQTASNLAPTASAVTIGTPATINQYASQTTGFNSDYSGSSSGGSGVPLNNLNGYGSPFSSMTGGGSGFIGGFSPFSLLSLLPSLFGLFQQTQSQQSIAATPPVTIPTTNTSSMTATSTNIVTATTSTTTATVK